MKTFVFITIYYWIQKSRKVIVRSDLYIETLSTLKITRLDTKREGKDDRITSLTVRPGSQDCVETDSVLFRCTPFIMRVKCLLVFRIHSVGLTVLLEDSSHLCFGTGQSEVPVWISVWETWGERECVYVLDDESFINNLF